MHDNGNHHRFMVMMVVSLCCLTGFLVYDRFSKSSVMKEKQHSIHYGVSK